METIERAGLQFRVTIEHDHDHGAPWDEEDGHGPVSDWRRHHRGDTDKRPGERVLCADRGSARFYDIAEAMRIAKRDGWGLNDTARAELAAKLGHAPTPGEVSAAAVGADFDRLRAWCNDQWGYVGVMVTLLDVDGEPVESCRDDLWGIESDSGDYLQEVAADCAANVIAAHKLQTRKTWREDSRGRSTVYRIRE